MYYSLLAEDCESFRNLKSHKGQVKLVLNFGNPKLTNDASKMFIKFIRLPTNLSYLIFNSSVGIYLFEEDSSGRGEPLKCTQNLDPSLCLPVSFVHNSLQKDQILLPSCLVCLSRLDKNVIGFSPLTCRDLYHFCCKEQCKYLSADCTVCACLSEYDEDDTPSHSLHCHDCGSRDDLWICLLCGNVGCGRYRGGHAHDHFEHSRHVFALNYDSHHIWDYSHDRYVHRTIRCAEGIVAVEEAPALAIESEDSFSADLSTAQLESQKAFFDERLRQQEAHFTRLLSTREAEFADQLQRLQNEIEHLQREGRIFTELKVQLQSRLHQHKSESDVLKKDLEAERMISAGLLERNNELLRAAKALATEKDELSEQITDLMKHFETLELVAQTNNDPDIVNGKIIMKSPAVNRKSKRKP